MTDMTERLTDEAMMKEAASMLAAEYRANGYDSYADVSEKQLGAFTLCSIRAIADALARRATPADDLRAALSLTRYSPTSTGNNMPHMVEDEAGQFISRKDIRAELAQKDRADD